MRLTKALIAAVCFLGAGSASAATLACSVKNPSSRDWVPKVVFVELNTQIWRAAVLDEFTVQVFEGAHVADLERPSSNRIQLSWKLVGVRNRQDMVQNVDFKMTLNLARMTFNYSGVSESSFVTPGSASGRCVELKVKE